MTVIGIDLGTTFSAVGVWKHDKATIFKDNRDRDAIESIIFFGESKKDTMLGQSARDMIDSYPERVIFDSKRMLGKRFSDTEIQHLIKKVPFKVVGDGRDRIFIDIPASVQNQRYPAMKLKPWKVSSAILRHLREVAKENLRLKEGEDVRDCVITVPANFSDGQKSETLKAAEKAGLHVVRMVTEPTAAAIAYGMHQRPEKETKLLVFDFGGGTLDISILVVQGNNKFVVKSTAGDVNLGGRDIDREIMQYIIKREKLEKHVNDDIFMADLQEACTEAKIRLSDGKNAPIYVRALKEKYWITRDQFNEICKEPIFDKLLDPVKEALNRAKLKPSDIDDIIKVGGSTHIPKVTEILEEFFKKRVYTGVDPQLAVVTGAAILAANVTGPIDESSDRPRFYVQEVCPEDLGIQLIFDRMSPIITACSPYGTTGSGNYTTTHDNQTVVSINVYEGDNPKASKNKPLGSFDLENLPPAPAGKVNIHVTFLLNENGILTATAQAEGAGTKSIDCYVTKYRYRRSSTNTSENSNEKKREDKQENKREDRQENKREDRQENKREDKQENKREDKQENKREDRQENAEKRPAAKAAKIELLNNIVDYIDKNRRVMNLFCKKQQEDWLKEAKNEIEELSSVDEITPEDYEATLRKYDDRLHSFYMMRDGKPEFLKNSL